jgi:putative endonuclease
MTEKINTGNQGENLAVEYLEKKGYEIIARNFRSRRSEIDLIVKKNNMIVFVEVKTRSSFAYGAPEAFVDYHKANMIIEGAEQYTFDNKWEGNIRFDIVSVKMGPEPELVHFEDAFC